MHYSLGGATIFAEIGKIFKSFPESREKFVKTTSTMYKQLPASYSYWIVEDVHLAYINFFGYFFAYGHTNISNLYL